ncbi:adenylate and guanylate cyclase catalytic domain-containing protein [Phlyctochytrium arcticum]|nr:adenylate and guanylate cyclase catalytic domain-containing protein [Phlyctochytrium arcticum]
MRPDELTTLPTSPKPEAESPSVLTTPVARRLVRAETSGPRPKSAHSDFSLNRPLSMVDSLRHEHNAPPTAGRSTASSTGTVDGMSNSDLDDCSSPGGSIWTRLKRNAPWASGSKKDLQYSAEDFQLQNVEEGKSASRPTSGKKRGKRPRSATFGQQSERVLGTGSISRQQLQTGSSMAAVGNMSGFDLSNGGKTRRWGGSTNHLGATNASSISDSIPVQFPHDGIGMEEEEEKDDIREEFDEIRNMRLAIDQDDDAQTSNPLGGPQDYLQTTMQDLFARANFIPRTPPHHSNVSSNAPYNPRRIMIPSITSLSTTPAPTFPTGRRMSDRGQPMRRAEGERSSMGSVSYHTTSRRASVISLMSVQAGMTHVGDTIREHTENQTLQTAASAVSEPLPEGHASGGPASSRGCSREASGSVLMLAQSSTQPASWSPSISLAQSAQIGLGMTDSAAGSASVQSSATGPRLGTFARRADVPEVLPELTHSAHDGTMPQTCHPPVIADTSDESDTQLNLTYPRHSEAISREAPAILPQSHFATGAHRERSSSIKSGSVHRGLTSVFGSRHTPVVPPSGFEPPDLSASSLNFEGGVMPAKYVARTSVFSGFGSSPKTTSRSKKRSEPGSTTETDASDTVIKRYTSVWESLMHPLSESPATGWNLRFKAPVEKLYRVWLFHLWVKPFQMTVFALLIMFWIIWIPIEYYVLTQQRPLVHAATASVIVTGLLGMCLSQRRSWETRWPWFMQFFFVLMALATLAFSAYSLIDGLDNTLGDLSSSNRFMFIQLCISAFGQLPSGNYVLLMWLFFFGQVAIEAVIFGKNGNIRARQLVGNWLLYFAVTTVGTHFRYRGEVLLRKAFIKYRIAYRNQARLFAAREQSEYLLSMILPVKVIETLHSLQGKVSDRLILSTHETFLELRGVTVLFADIVGFTEFSSSITAEQLVEILSELFSEFDAMVAELGLETIKTIGDCFQVAGGVPEQLVSEEQVQEAAERICTLALIMLTATRRLDEHVNVNKPLRLRIGIHTGTVIGGVMGLWKFKYDIWSRDVDIASLLEQSGRPSVPHVSETTYALLRDRTNLTFMPAADLTVFGRVMHTYEILALAEDSDSLERLAAKLRISGDYPLGSPRSGSAGGSGEAVTAAAVRQAFGTSNGMVVPDGTVPGTTTHNMLPLSTHMNNGGTGTKKLSGKSTIGTTVKKFQKSIYRLSAEFRDPDIEKAYREDYMRTWPGALIVASMTVLLAYLCLFGAHVAIFEATSPAIIIIEGICGLLLFGLIIFTHHLNKPYRLKVTRIVDKGDRLASALWINSVEELSNSRKLGASFPSIKKDKWSWFRPNLFAILTLFSLFLSCCLHLGTIDLNSIGYHSGGILILAIASVLYPGIKTYYINFATVVFTITFFVAQVCAISLKYESPVARSVIQKLLPDIFQHMFLSLIAVLRANRSYDYISRLNYFIKRQTEQDYAETKRTQAAAERMLLNILPLRVVQRLKDNPGVHIADEANVAILFCFISNFNTSDEITDIENIWTLNDIICDMDALARSRNVEKIKTIGTKYMAIAEPQPDCDEHPAQRLTDFALDLLDVVRAFNARAGQSFSVRMGIHMGPAVCGLIGTRTFAYDVWGDTANVASRMETTGMDEHIQVTQAVYDLLNDRYLFRSRGKVYVKGKGEMEGYFVLGQLDKAMRRPALRRVSMARDDGITSTVDRRSIVRSVLEE